MLATFVRDMLEYVLGVKQVYAVIFKGKFLAAGEVEGKIHKGPTVFVPNTCVIEYPPISFMPFSCSNIDH
jgi:hypothetical protein